LNDLERDAVDVGDADGTHDSDVATDICGTGNKVTLLERPYQLKDITWRYRAKANHDFPIGRATAMRDVIPLNEAHGVHLPMCERNGGCVSCATSAPAKEACVSSAGLGNSHVIAIVGASFKDGAWTLLCFDLPARNAARSSPKLFPVSIRTASFGRAIAALWSKQRQTTRPCEQRGMVSR